MKFSFLTPEEIATSLKVEETDVLNWLENGDMNGIKMGAIWRVREDQFDEFINAKATGLPPVASCHNESDKESNEEKEDYPAIRLRKPRTHKTPRRYAKLKEYFLRKRERRIQLTFEQIEKIIERKLPDSSIYRAFWANDSKHSQSKAWMEAGWRVKAVNFDEHLVYFERKQ